MRRIHLTPDIHRALLIRQALENHGIACTILGEHTSFGASAFGGMLERRLEVWVIDAEAAKEAERVIEALFAERSDEAASPTGWTCPGCGEKIEAAFTACWRCGRERV
ncbi:putative signal transducing protein [Rhodocaloribacter sp.]